MEKKIQEEIDQETIKEQREAEERMLQLEQLH